MIKLTGQMLHEAFSQAYDEIVAAQHTLPAPQPKDWDEVTPVVKKAYHRMAAILNKRQREKKTRQAEHLAVEEASPGVTWTDGQKHGSAGVE